MKYLFEEVTGEDREPTKFKGYLDDAFNSGGSGNANYAIMVYDAKKNVFKIAPIEQHYKFEKCKNCKFNNLVFAG